jgi:hypothetical protein
MSLSQSVLDAEVNQLAKQKGRGSEKRRRTRSLELIDADASSKKPCSDKRDVLDAHVAIKPLKSRGRRPKPSSDIVAAAVVNGGKDGIVSQSPAAVGLITTCKTFADAGVQTDDANNICVCRQQDKSVTSGHNDLMQTNSNQPAAAAAADHGLNETVTKCIAALILPVSQDLNRMHNDLDGLKSVLRGDFQTLEKEFEGLKATVADIVISVAALQSQSNNTTVASAVNSEFQTRRVYGRQTGHFTPPPPPPSSAAVTAMCSALSSAPGTSLSAGAMEVVPSQDLRQSERVSSEQPQTRSGYMNGRLRRRETDASSQLKQDVLASMYVDMDLKQRRARNIIVSGLPYNDDDFRAVGDLLVEEFSLQHLPIVSCKRIGRRIENRVQPLLVTMETREDADYFVANAKLLRDSWSPVVSECVFISADLTPAESKAAYELRCRRREMLQRGQDSTSNQFTGAPSRVFYRTSVAGSGGALTAAAGGPISTLRYRMSAGQSVGSSSSSAAGAATCPGDGRQ